MSFFDVKQSFDKCIYRSFNVISDIIFQCSPGLRKILSANSIYKNKHLGERCFVLGSGPSLASVTLKQVENLKSEVLFGVNSIYKASVVSELTPKYYALLDNNYWGVSKDAFLEIADAYAHSPPVFVTDRRANYLVPRDLRRIVLHAKNYPVDHLRYEITGNISITMNVVSFCIVVAIYMGFKEIYLLGCDYNLFCSRSGTHCYNDEDELNELPSHNLGFYLRYYHLTTEFHYAIARLAKKKGVKIINLSEGSLLDAYPIEKIGSVL